jgi:hypothetical protein
MLTPEFLKAKFQHGLSYERYVEQGTPDQRARWERHYNAVALTPEQEALLRGFTRRMNVLVTSGMWCGDCAVQVPMMARIAQGAPVIDLRMLDRDQHLDLAEQVMICGGLRVPTAIFLNEDFEFVSILGDKSLARLRAQAARAVGEGAYCQLPGVEQPQDEAAATLADWLAEFERVQLLLRLSPKLRERYGD